MKRENLRYGLMVAILGLLLAPGVFAQPYSGIYVFGESLLDTGNAKAAWWSDLGIELIPSPPYAEGRFCNGPVHPDVLADNLGLGPVEPSVAGGTNYGFGGARSVVDYFYGGVLFTPSVRTQVEAYLDDVGSVADPDALYLLQDGGNDTGAALQIYMATGDWDAATAIMEESALGLVGSIQMLADAGAVHFVVPGGPEFSHKPNACGVAAADALIDYYNARLETELASLGDDLHIVYVDIASFMRGVLDHFVSDCSYCVSLFDSTVPACSNPNELMYWDEVHPSAPVQQLIGDVITLTMIKDQLLRLASNGALNGGQANALLTKLNGAYGKLEDRETGTATNKMRAFLNQVEAFVRVGIIPPDEAELLLVGAAGVIDQP